MRFWQKICICSLIFFLIVYFCSGIIMIENNKTVVFERTLQQAADQQVGIQSGIMYYVMINRAKYSSIYGLKDETYIKEYLESRVNTRGIYLEIWLGDEIIYRNLNIELPEEMINDSKGVVTYKIREIEGRRHLILTSYSLLKNKDLKIIYMMDINHIYEDRKQQYAFFYKLAVVVSILLSTGMYAIIGHLTKSLHILTESVKKMGAGNYKERVRILAKDEMGKLAESYNEMAQAIEEKIKELEDVTKQQQRFIDNFTHEVRTPLTAVVGYADLLRSTSYNQEFSQEIGEKIFREGKRIEKLSELMMDLIFLERHVFKLKPCKIEEVIGEMIERLTPIVEKYDIKLTGILPEQSLIIVAEKELLLNLLENLIDNARKASKPGDEITIRGRKEDNAVILEVEDRGKGIPIEEKKRVFERFYMVDKVRNSRNNGVGLGLSICSDIVKIHKARMEMSSEEEKGTVVKIMFPCYNLDTKLHYYEKHTR